MSIEDFIRDKKTPYSEISEVEIEGDFVNYKETYNLSHPDCPVKRVIAEGVTLNSLAVTTNFPRSEFDLLYGNNEKE